MNLNDSNLMRELNTKTAGTLLIGRVINRQGGGQEYAVHRPETPDRVFAYFTLAAINRIQTNSRYS